MPKENNINKISISRKSIIIILLFIILLLFMIYIRYLILTLILAFILASFAKYSANLLQDTYKINYRYGISAIFIALIILVISSISLLLPLLIKESYGLIELINSLLTQIESGVTLTGFPIDNLQLTQFTNLIPNLGQVTLKALSVFGEIVTYTLLIFVLAFYISINDTGLNAFIKLFSTNEVKKNIPNIISKLQYHIGKWAFIEVGIAIIMSIFIYTTLSILEFQYAAILGILAGVFQLVPILGPMIIYLVIILIAFIQSPILGVITILLVLSIHIIKQFLLLPIIFQSSNNKNSLLVVFALMIGGILSGVLGVIVAMPVVALSRIIYRDIMTYAKQ